MGSRWLNATIVLFWMATTTWLFWAKVLPSLLQGEPPTYEAMLPAADGPKTVQVGWQVFWNDQPVGTAIGTVNRGKDGFVKVEHQIRLHELRLYEFPPQLSAIFGLAPRGDQRISMDVDSTMTFDNHNHLLAFTSNIGFGNSEKLIKVTGVVDGNLLKIDLRYGGTVFATTEKTLPPESLVIGQLSPHGLLKGLRYGQQWTVPVYTYFNPNETMEILHAKVEGSRQIEWNGQQVTTWLVVYRTDPASGFGHGGEVRKKFWVRQDGVVLQQSTKLLGNWLKFVRSAGLQSARFDDEKQAGDSQGQPSEDLPEQDQTESHPASAVRSPGAP